MKRRGVIKTSSKVEAPITKPDQNESVITSNIMSSMVVSDPTLSSPSNSGPASTPVGPSGADSSTHSVIHFASVIEADHASIARLARRLTSRVQTISQCLTDLTALVTRLVRHDISEELIMRPAFIRYLGPAGAKAAAQDRLDHADLKARLVKLYETIVSTANGHSHDSEDRFWPAIKILSAEMAQHMVEESGVILPRLESKLTREQSLDLGRRYIKTLVLTPEVCTFNVDAAAVVNESTLESHVPLRDIALGERCSISFNSEKVEMPQRCFEDVMDYARADMRRFRGILEQIEIQARRGTDHGYFAQSVEKELREMGLSMPLPSPSDSADKKNIVTSLLTDQGTKSTTGKL